MKRTLRLGDALIEPNLNSISRDGQITRVEPKAMSVLVYLCERAGDVVPKEQLIRAVWPDTYVTDYVLTRCISSLRKALGDDARAPHVIQTISKGGYRLVSPVEWIDQAQGIDSLAVLPLVNETGDANLEYLSDGLTEAIINRLSELPELRVVARSTAFRYKGAKDDPVSIGRALDVAAVLTGRVVHFGDTLTISAELIDVGRSSQIWGQHYRESAADVVRVQEDIAGEISERLRPKLAADHRKHRSNAYTSDTEAYGRQETRLPDAKTPSDPPPVRVNK